MSEKIVYVATINVPGYLPEGDPLYSHSLAECWGFLRDERQRDEDSADYGDSDTGEYSETVRTLDYIASGEHQHGNPNEDTPTNADGTGTIYGDSPGMDSPHDLGLAYSVSVTSDVRWDDESDTWVSAKDGSPIYA